MFLPKEERKIATRIFKYFRPYTLYISITILLSIVLGSVPVLTARYIKKILDDVLIAKNYTLLFAVCVGVLVLYAINGLAKYFQEFIVVYISESVSKKLREEAYAKFTSLSFAYFSKNKVGAMISKVINDVVTLNDGLTAITILAKEPITILSLLAYATYLNWKLMLFSLLVAPLMALIFAIIGKKIQKYAKRSLELLGDLSVELQETFSGIRIIKAFQLETPMKKKFSNQNTKYLKIRIKNASVQLLSSPLTVFLAVIAGVVMLFFGGTLVIKGQFTAGSFFAFLASVGLIIDPLRKLNTANIRINTAIAGAKRVFEVLDYKENLPICKNPIPLNEVKDTIEFKNVSFAYEEKIVLNKISFSAKVGDRIAFVGQSGAGKTTLLNLIPRFYHVSEGEILFDGKAILTLELQSLRSKIALVTQETFLFNDTIAQNISYGNTKASFDEIVAAAKAANAHDFIMEFPEQYETILGDRGTRLSGGQRQRVAIARAILKDAPILILDEATSALDSESEKLVQNALEVLMEGRTTFMVAHRLSTIKKANSIMVLQNGKIIEEGTHQNLLSRQGAYANFYKLQDMT